MRDRLPQPGKEGRVKITQDNGQVIEGVLDFADNATQAGSAYTKGNVLPDTVCDALGIDRVTSEPKDALSLIRPLELIAERDITNLFNVGSAAGGTITNGGIVSGIVPFGEYDLILETIEANITFRAVNRQDPNNSGRNSAVSISFISGANRFGFDAYVQAGGPASLTQEISIKRNFKGLILPSMGEYSAYANGNPQSTDKNRISYPPAYNSRAVPPNALTAVNASFLSLVTTDSTIGTFRYDVTVSRATSYPKYYGELTVSSGKIVQKLHGLKL